MTLTRRRFLAGALTAAAAAVVLPALPAWANGAIPVDHPDLWLSKSGTGFTVDGVPYRVAGTNCYYLGLDDNILDADGNPTYPTPVATRAALASAELIGLGLVRAKTLGISCGSPASLLPSLGTINPAAFVPIDDAVRAARWHHQRLMIPLTDEWRWYHGGKWCFVHNRAGQNGVADTIADLSQNCGNSDEEKELEAQFYTNDLIIADFLSYITTLLTHVNAYTGIALADDPTCAVWQTGNELFDATPAWTEQVTAHIKSLAPNALVADGSAASGLAVADMPGLADPNCDIVGSHYYPRNATQLAADLTAAAGAGKVFVADEYDWTGDGEGPTLAAWHAQLEQSGAAMDAWWTLLPTLNDVPEAHDDGYQMWNPVPAVGNPISEADSVAALAQFSAHAGAMVAPQVAPVQARTADSFAGFIGVGTHLGYTDEIYGDQAVTTAALDTLGVRVIRDGWGIGYPGQPNQQDTFLKQLNATLGIQAILIQDLRQNCTPAQRQAQIAVDPALVASIWAIEGPNEWDDGSGTVAALDNQPWGLPYIAAQQQAIWTAYRDDVRTASLPILGPSFADQNDTANFAAVGDLSAVLDAGAVHDYMGNQPGSEPEWAIIRANNGLVSGTSALATTECGWEDDLATPIPGNPSLGDGDIAVAITLGIFERWLAGDLCCCTYELFDESSTASNQGRYGLFANDGVTIKAQGTAIKTLMALTSDPGPAFTPGTLSYAVTGGTSNTRTLLLARRDGSFLLAVWESNVVWSPSCITTLPDVAPVAVTVTLPATMAADVYRPALGASLVASSTGPTVSVGSSAVVTLVHLV